MRSVTFTVLGLVALSYALPRGTLLSGHADGDHQDLGVISAFKPGKRAAAAMSLVARQTTKPSNCDAQQLLELMAEYSILETLFGDSPPAAVQTDMALIQAYLASCGTSVGGIIPATPTTATPTAATPVTPAPTPSNPSASPTPSK